MLSVRHAPAQRRNIWPPEPGFFVMKLVKDGWRVPARISFEPARGWYAEVDEFVHPAHSDPVQAPMLSAIWHSALKICEADYRYFVAMKDWARANDPSHPCLHPRKPVDPRQLRPVSIPVKETA